MRSIPVLLLCVLMTGCFGVQKTSSYTPQQMSRAATVFKGEVLAMRDVFIEGSESGTGVTAGAIAGGTAGTYAGGGWQTSVIGAVGGAVVGGIAGMAAEKALTEAGAVEFILQQENGQTIAVVQTNEEGLVVGEKVLILRSDRVRVIRDTTTK